MRKIKVLIADDNLLATQKLADKLSRYKDFELITAKDGIETIEQIHKYNPDVVLLDVIMPKLDGVGVLEYAKSNFSESKPVFIAYSAISQENYISRVMNLGAAYYIIKPFDESIIATRIVQLYHDLVDADYIESETKEIDSNNKSNVAQRVKNRYDDELMVLATKYMREYGLKAHMTGYSYIRDIIIEAFDSYCQTGSMPKGIYRTIANKNGVSVQKVERAIRNCIENVKDFDSNEKKPTNSNVICELIEKIRYNN
jgi:two-component system response regulator (stage 0 sporulation protein A)